MGKWVLVAVTILLCVMTVCAQTPLFDLYHSAHRGDTLRDGIDKIFLHENRHGHIAFVKYTDGRKACYNFQDIKAFSFLEPRGTLFWWNTSYNYHQVQTLVLADSTSKINTPKFYEKLAECNGHIL